MLEVLIGSIIDYYKISDFYDKSIETLIIRHKEYNWYIKTATAESIKTEAIRP